MAKLLQSSSQRALLIGVVTSIFIFLTKIPQMFLKLNLFANLYYNHAFMAFMGSIIFTALFFLGGKFVSKNSLKALTAPNAFIYLFAVLAVNIGIFFYNFFGIDSQSMFRYFAQFSNLLAISALMIFTVWEGFLRNTKALALVLSCLAYCFNHFLIVMASSLEFSYEAVYYVGTFFNVAVIAYFFSNLTSRKSLLMDADRDAEADEADGVN